MAESSRLKSRLAFAMSASLLAAVILLLVPRVTGKPLSALLNTVPQLLAVEPTTFQSDAHLGQIVSASFKVTNISDQPVRILGSNTSCSCTVVNNDFPMELKPGEMQIVKVQMTVADTEARLKVAHTALLLVNRSGMVPPLNLEVRVLNPVISPIASPTIPPVVSP